MGRMRMSGWVVAGLLSLGCSESRTAPENEACLGAAPAGSQVANSELGMPTDEPSLEAWVIREQGGILRVTTRPCDPKPSSKMLIVLADAPVAQRDGKRISFADIEPGDKISAWYAGGSSGKARAVVIERRAPWPPGSEPAATPEPAPEPTPESEATPAAP